MGKGFMSEVSSPASAVEFHSLYGRMLVGTVSHQVARSRNLYSENNVHRRMLGFERLAVTTRASYRDLHDVTLGSPSIELCLVTILFAHCFVRHLKMVAASLIYS
jgi:hypothetical protein